MVDLDALSDTRYGLEGVSERNVLDLNEHNDTEILYSSSSGSFDGVDFNLEENDEEERSEHNAGDFSEEYAVDNIGEIMRVKFDQVSHGDLTRYHFIDIETAFLFYNHYASHHGFAARKDRVHRSNNGEVLQQTFVCHRQGTKIEKPTRPGVKKRSRRPTSRCGCQAEFVVHIDCGSGRWYIKKMFDVHNHSLLDSSFKGMLPAHRKMSEHDKYQMILMRDAGIKTRHIYGYYAEQSGGFDKVGYFKRDMYNQQVKRRRTNFSDAKAAMDYLAGLGSGDSEMFYRHTVDEDGHLRNLFWCDGISRMDYSIFGDVLAFDATYKKLKYLSPFVVFSGVNHHNQSVVFGGGIVGDESEITYIWMLEQFLEAMGGKCPISVITDGDVRMKNAIAKVFPKAHHRLCAWHLLRNATTHVKKQKFVEKLKPLMFKDMDVGDFERNWQKLVDEFGLWENGWVLELYERRHMWSSSCIRGSFFAGFRTTSRCEGLNSQFGKYVCVLSNLLDFVKHFFRWLEYMRYREFEADYESASYVEPVMVTHYRFLEKYGASVFTKEIQKIFQQVLQRAANCYVSSSSDAGSVFLYKVSRYDKEGMEWEVSFCDVSLKFKCCCLRFESLGLPCEHIVSVLLYLGIKQIPESLVLKRWSKAAKDGLVLPVSNLRERLDPDMLSSYVGIVERCQRMAKLVIGSRRPQLVRKLIEFINIYTNYFERVGSGEELEMPSADPYTDGTIKNPVRVRHKGCGMTPSSQTKSKRTPGFKVTCTLCGKKGHNRRSCLTRGFEFTQEGDILSSSTNEELMDSDELEDANVDMAGC